MTKRNKIPCGSMINTVQEYNTHFNETPNLTITYSVASKKFPTITRNFSNRWHPSETKHLYLSTFSISEWNTLAPEEKTNKPHLTWFSDMSNQVSAPEHPLLKLLISRLLLVNCTLTRFDYLHNQSKRMKKNMTLSHPFQTELNHISAEVKQALIHKYEEMHSHTQR